MAPTLRPLDPPVRRLLWVAGAVTFLAHLALNGRYGFFRDELYFIACGEHLAWGYVDQPPLVAVAARLAVALFDHSLWGFRVPANVGAAAAVMLTGALTHRLGGRSYAVLLAMLAVGLAPDSLVRGHLMTMNAFEPALWLAIAYVLAGMLATGSPRAWPWVGVLVGLGMLNKYSTAYWVVALLAGLVLTPQRRLLASRWLALAVGIAAVMVLPNVLWQASHGWPMLELLRRGQLYKNAEFHAAAFFSEQALMMAPLTTVVVLLGVGYLLLGRGVRSFRSLGIAVVVGEVLFTLTRGKPYYATPLLPAALAGGCVYLEHAFGARAWLRTAAAALLALLALPPAPMAVPLLSPDAFIAYQRALGVQPQRLEKMEYRELPQHFADQFGWEQMVRTVAEAWQRLPPEQRARTGLFAQNYGEAGALDFFGKAYGLPPARAGHNQYYFWGLEQPEVDGLLILGGDAEDHRQECGSLVEVARVPPHPYVMPYEDRLPVFHCTRLKRPLREIWPEVKFFI